MHWFWKVAIVICLVLAIPTAVWVVREISARKKAADEAKKLAGG